MWRSLASDPGTNKLPLNGTSLNGKTIYENIMPMLEKNVFG